MRTKETENLFDIIQHKIINLDTDHKFKVATNVQYTFTNILSNIVDDYYGAAEPPVRCGVSHLSGLTEPLH